MIDPSAGKLKNLLIGAGLGVLVFVLSMGWPMHVPLGSVIQFLFPAIGMGLTAAALVLIYRTVRVINFSQTAMGIISAQLFYEFYTRHIFPYPIALLVGLAAGVIVGLLIGIISATLFFRHPRLVMTVVTIFFVGLIAYIGQQINGAFVKPGEIRHPEAIIGPFPKAHINISNLPFRFAHLVGFVMLLAVTFGLVVFFRRTRVGTAVRASAENSDRAALLGINVKMLQVGVWTLVGLIASVSALAVLSVQPYNPAAGADPTELLLPLAAAVIARMSSMPVAFFSAAGFVVLQNAVTYSSGLGSLIQIGLFVLLNGALLLQKRKMLVRADESTSWKAVKEVRPMPRELLALPSIKRTRLVLFGILAVVVLGVPWITASDTIVSFTQVWTFAIIAISLVLLTGWTGQISLGQMAFVTIGAWVGGNMTMRMHIPFWFALPLSGLVGAFFAFIIGLPALRIRGLFLAASTFSLAVVMPIFVFGANPTFLGKWTPTQGVVPPKLFLDFADPKWMYYLSFALFVLVVAGMGALRRSRGGRVLIALRDNENGVQSFGVDVVKTRLTAFAMSGFIAAFAGALFVHQTRGMDQMTYSAFISIQIFIIVVIGGVSAVSGAVLGAVFLVGGVLLFPGLQQIITGVAGLIVLMAIPGGLTQVVFGTRDAVLRVVAMRKHIVVPSLFADYSPDAWEKKLAPLSAPLQSQGLGSLKPDQRYSLPSKILGKASV